MPATLSIGPRRHDRHGTEAQVGRPRAERTGSLRTRWAAVGAAVAVTLGAGGLLTANATSGSGDADRKSVV